MSRMITKFKNYLLFRDEKVKDKFVIDDENDKKDISSEEIKNITEKDVVSDDIIINMVYVKRRFSYDKNDDVVIREIVLKNKKRAFVMFIDGMVSTDYVNNGVIKSLLEIPYFTEDEIIDYKEQIYQKFVSHSQAMVVTKMDDVFEEVNFGSCALFIDGYEKAVILDVRDWGHRSIDKPDNEKSIYGPQEAFGEMLRNNTVLVRKIIKSENLIAEGIKIGTKSKTRGVMLYLSDIANKSIVDEVRKRLNSIDMDYVISIEEVSMMIEEDTFLTSAHFIQTERPDRVARALTQGRVAFILNGSPQALILPSNAFELLHAVSDDYLRVPYANMARIIRLTAVSFSALLPALYLAITLFHQEIIPTYLLYSISASREYVPFPSIIELLLMDLSFEMIREAGIRMPGPVGSTLGIVGGLILGQAAVSAKIVSPIMIIIIAITGIGSFATADYNLSWSLRIMKLIFIFLAYALGFYGIALGIFLFTLSLAAQKSIGIPFLSPLFKLGSRSTANAVLVNPIWRRENRPGFLHTKEKKEKPVISRKWK